jgi:general stress protein YciG
MSNKDKGFASMDNEKVKEIAAKGGHASHRDSNKESHGNGRRESDNRSNSSNNNLSDAANRMRTSDSAEERSKAASEMGREGGRHSQDNEKR